MGGQSLFQQQGGPVIPHTLAIANFYKQLSINCTDKSNSISHEVKEHEQRRSSAISLNKTCIF